jgi:hypothetical protein
MWLVLLEANGSKNFGSLAGLKRFLFVVGGLDTQEHSPELKALFSKFKPFMLNRIANQSKAKPE